MMMSRLPLRRNDGVDLRHDVLNGPPPGYHPSKPGNGPVNISTDVGACIHCRTDSAEQSKDMITVDSRFIELRKPIASRRYHEGADFPVVRTSIFALSGTLARVVVCPTWASDSTSC